MIKAVLFDLDGTLLDIDMNYFIEQYFRLMIQMARQRGVPHERLVDSVLKATDAMIRDKDPQRLNCDVFREHFFLHSDIEPEVFDEFIEEFYTKGFPRLSIHTSPFPGIREIMMEAFAGGRKVVIATNSVFPRSAILDRLSWAGLGDFPYDYITTYENMHFTKPHLEYYQEICDQIGVAPEECLVVGNDVGEDMIAGELGMQTFLLLDRLIDNQKVQVKPHFRGHIQDLGQLVRGLSSSSPRA